MLRRSIVGIVIATMVLIIALTFQSDEAEARSTGTSAGVSAARAGVVTSARTYGSPRYVSPGYYGGYHYGYGPGCRYYDECDTDAEEVLEANGNDKNIGAGEIFGAPVLFGIVMGALVLKRRYRL